MAWPPAIVCRRIALVAFGISLLLYLMVTGMLMLLGLDTRLVLVLSQFIALFGLALWLARLMRLPLREAFSLRPAAAVHWYMVAAAALPLQVAGGALQYAILQNLPPDSAMRQLMEETLNQFVAVDNGVDLLMLFAAAVVTAAICEEFLFRGLILGLLARRAGWVSAIVWSATLFAIYHLNPVVLLPVTLVGLYLGLLVWRSGSLYPAIAAHALNNGLALFGLPYLIDEATYERYLGLTLVVSLALLALMLYAYLRLSPTVPRFPDRDPPLVGTDCADSEARAPTATPVPGAAPRWPERLEGDGVDRRLGDGEKPEQTQ
ncbi:MAG: type II CAAX endopeptidase family protein [Acidobacteriota bacterium]|jgi:membrane protease YdiL (CAAX protease family)